jgi:hypothetical protein
MIKAVIIHKNRQSAGWTFLCLFPDPIFVHIDFGKIDTYFTKNIRYLTAVVYPGVANTYRVNFLRQVTK